MKPILLNIRHDRFCFRRMPLRRFIYHNPSKELVLGATGKHEHSPENTHAALWWFSGTVGKFDDAIRGWIGRSSDYPAGVIRFFPMISTQSARDFDAAFSLMSYVKKCGAAANMEVKFFGGVWRQTLEEIVV